jgi:uncharacterized membrane protein
VIGRLPRSALALALVGLIGVAISLYLTWTKVAGVAPICGPSGGCETVEASSYSAVAGIPVALFGVAYSDLIVILAVAWGRTGDSRPAYAAYALGLAGALIEAYLVDLELVVIRAICLWCVAYGLTIVIGLAISIAMVRRSPRQPTDRTPPG